MAGPPGGKEREVARVGRDEIYGRAGDPVESLRIAMSVFGEPFRPLNDAIAGLVETGQDVHLLFELKTAGDNPQVLRLELSKGDPTKHATIVLEGDWPENTGVPSGIPRVAGFSGRFSLINPTTGEPFAKPGDWIPPEGRIGIGTAAIGKVSISTFSVRLPGAEFPGGGNFRGYAGIDGPVELGTVLYYVEKVEVVK